tara:strand:- start:2 stop:598 length:597 start_codon:yes stop_codon:yes gene_type:complete
MRIFLSVLILIFSLQSWTKADDIRDFEIEGMSVGDSALDYFSEEKIKENISNTIQYNEIMPGADEYLMIFFLKNEINLKIYDDITFYFKKSDNKYLISSIGVSIYFNNKFNKCLKKKEIIKKDIENLLNIKFTEEKKKKFPNDTSLMQGNGYVFESNDTIQLVCYKWSKKMKKQNRRDQLFLSLNDSEYELWVIENIN